MSASAFFRTPPVQVALDIGARQVVAVSIAGPDTAPRVGAYAVEALPEGAVVPSLNASNVLNRDVVHAAVARALSKLGTRPRRVGLVVPDTVAKVSLVRFAKVPSRGSDLEELIRFQVRKTAPFRPEEAVVSYSRGSSGDGGQEFVVVQAKRDVIQEYEDACAAAGATAGLVDLATFNVISAVMATEARSVKDWLLVNVTADYAAIAILRDADLMFFRNRSSEGDGQLSDLVHQTAMYYQDRLGGSGFGRVMLAEQPNLTGGTDVRRELESRLGMAVESVDPTRAVPLPDRIGPAKGLVAALTPAIGLVLAQRRTARGGGV
jgi:type IV pilus assembly protein PilM